LPRPSIVERRFSAEVMARGYEAAYRAVLNLPTEVGERRPALKLVNDGPEIFSP
jgi:hypothetical protein